MHVADTDKIRRITFDRPDARNALSPEIAVELAESIEAIDPTMADAVVLTGEGSAFSAGGDIDTMAEREESASEGYERITATFGRLAEAVLDCPVPVVAQVNGDAVGAGLSLVALSDFAYTTPEARFGAAFIHVGLIPDTGGSVLLPRLVGLRAAKRLVFTGELIGAAEAAELGLVNEVVADGQLDGTVDDLVATLADRPTRTIGLSKQALHGVLGRGVEAGIEYEAQLMALAADSPEHEEGVSAFLEGRDPDFE